MDDDIHVLDTPKKEVDITPVLQSEFGRMNFFRIYIEERDIISVCCMKNNIGNVVSDADDMKDIRRSS